MRPYRPYIITVTFFLIFIFAINGSSASLPWFSSVADSDPKENQEQEENIKEIKEEKKEISDSSTNKADIEDANGTENESISLPDGTSTLGSQGEGVQNIQAALHRLGYDVPVDGIYNTETAQAIYHFQQYHDELDNDGIYGPTTRSKLEERLALGQVMDTEGQLQVDLPISSFQDPENQFPARGELVEDPNDILVLVNKENHLTAGYTPVDLMKPDVPFPFAEDLPQRLMQAEAAAALELLFEASKNEGLHLFAQSGFRSFNRQQTIFASNVAQKGEEQANQYSARAGESEHQTGLVMDVTSKVVNFQLITEFADTDEGQWLAENVADFGFIVRYPKGKEDITGYQYEPWHIRYVGNETAKVIMDNSMTLEEYLEQE